MHEALITRGDVQRPSWHSIIERIYSPFNCVIRHHVCPDGQWHTPGHGGPETFEKCARAIVKWEGQIPTRNWLVEMMDEFPQVARDALLRFDAIDFSQGDPNDPATASA